MQQRLGIAQAIIADPELLILDELSSGLDPVGRCDLREVLLDLKRRGRTIFFSSHELTEVETLCDRVVMIDRGRIVTRATVAELMKPLNLFEITFDFAPGEAIPASLADLEIQSRDGRACATINDVERYSRAIHELTLAGISIRSTASKTRTLEEHFIDLVQRAAPGDAGVGQGR
jgi:ABC-2 type transport system ATP-binding protein